MAVHGDRAPLDPASLVVGGVVLFTVPGIAVELLVS